MDCLLEVHIEALHPSDNSPLKSDQKVQFARVQKCHQSSHQPSVNGHQLGVSLTPLLRYSGIRYLAWFPSPRGFTRGPPKVIVSLLTMSPSNQRAFFPPTLAGYYWPFLHHHVPYMTDYQITLYHPRSPVTILEFVAQPSNASQSCSRTVTLFMITLPTGASHQTDIAAPLAEATIDGPNAWKMISQVHCQLGHSKP